jgi:hypothetical protein
MDKALDYKYLKGEFDENEYNIADNNMEKAYCKIFNLNEFKNRIETDKMLEKFVKYLKANGVFDVSILEEI